MDGIQKTVCIALRELALKVEGQAFGQDDDFDAEAFEEDLEEIKEVAV